MKKITRTFETTKIHSATIKVVDKEVKPVSNDVIEIKHRRLTEKQAITELRKKFGKKANFAITELEYVKECYEIEYEKFMEHAVKVEIIQPE